MLTNWSVLYLMLLSAIVVDALPLMMDIQWVLQGRSIQFDGFFTEFLGYSQEISTKLPLLRLVKSSYATSLDEPSIEVNSSVLNDLFPNEQALLRTIIAQNLTDPDHITDIPRSMFGNHVSCTSCCTNPIQIGEGGLDESFSLAKHLIATHSALECCSLCQKHAFCVAWVYEESTGLCDIKGQLAKPSAIRNSDLPSTSPPVRAILSGRMVDSSTATNRERLSIPRALILHGTTCVWRNETLTRRRDINTILIGRVMVERASFTQVLTLGDYAVASCAAIMDEIWVPTEWHRQVFSRMLMEFGASTSIVIFPEAVDTNLFDPAHYPPRTFNGCAIDDETNCVHCLQSQRFVFLSIFKWEDRKGWDILLRTYFATFRPEDDVLLVIHSYMAPPFSPNTNITEIISDFAMHSLGKHLSDLPPVHVVRDHRHVAYLPADHPLQSLHEHADRRAGLNRSQIRDLYALSDAFVLPTRGEGWGLPIVEAMAMALPVLATNYSGPTAYLMNDNAYPIPVESQLDATSFAIPNEVRLSELMRQVIRDYSTPSATPSDHEVCDMHSSESAGTCPSGISVARRRGVLARKRMQELSAAHAVGLMVERLKFHGARRGWEF